MKEVHVLPMKCVHVERHISVAYITDRKEEEIYTSSQQAKAGQMKAGGAVSNQCGDILSSQAMMFSTDLM